VALVVFLVQSFMLWQFSIDDVAISYRYAGHLAEGQGLNWNPGQPPVEGYSNFLWVLILAGGRGLGFDIELFSKIIGVVVALGAMVFLQALSRRLWGGQSFSIIPVWIVAVCPVWALWTVSGLELALVGFFLIWAVFALTAKPATRIRHLVLALCGLSLSRPEGFLLSGLLLVFSFLADRELPRPRRWIVYGIPALAVAGCAGALVIFRLAYFGYPVANTVYAKFSADLPSYREVGKWLFFGLPFFAAYILLLRSRLSSKTRLVTGAALSLVLWQMIIVLPASPVMYFLHRYQIAFLPLLVLAVPAALQRLAVRGRTYAIGAVVLVLLWAAQQWPSVLAKYEAELHYYHRHECVVQKLNDLPGRPMIALLDAGRIPYWSDLPAIDAWGLCDSHIAQEGFSPERVFNGPLGPPDVYIMTIDTKGSDAVPRMGFDKLISGDEYFQAQYTVWEVCPSDYYYGYAIMVNKDWAERNGVN